MASKCCLGLETWSTTTNLHKGYNTENTPDEGGSKEKSQKECRIYIHILPSWPLLWYLYGWIISAVHTKWENTSKQKWKMNWRKKNVLSNVNYLGRRERFYFLSLFVWIRGQRLNCWLTGLERVPLGWYIADTREINGDNFLRNSGEKDPGRVQETWSKLLLPPFYWIRKENIQPFLHGHNDRRHSFLRKKKWKAGKRATI